MSSGETQYAIAAGPHGVPGPAIPAPPRALAAWALFDWATQPFYTLIVTFLFAPYFATTVVGDVARGQELWGYAAAVAGILVGVGSPVLGAMADGRGRRKPWIAGLALLLIVAMAALWFARPAASSQTIAFVLVAFIAATVAAEFMSVFTNAIMPTLVPHSQIGRLSGIGWGVGYAGGLVSLILMAGLVVTDPASGKTLLGLEPLWRFDQASRESDRLIGPFSAVWFLIFVVPFFLFVPDVRRPVSANRVRASAFSELRATLRALPAHPDMLYFLIARAIYADGMSAIFTFGGIYGSAVFGWGAFELGLFGIILVLTGALGAVIGGILDDRLGSKNVILGALVLLLIGVIGILSVSQGHVLYSVPVQPKDIGSRPFSTTGEHVFLMFALLVGIVAAPIGAASRSMLAHLAPPEKMTQFFGLFAFSGKVTAFAAPLLIAITTRISGSQRVGMAVIGLFLVTGFLLMLRVRQPRFSRPEAVPNGGSDIDQRI